MEIKPIHEENIGSFWQALDTVAREGKYLLMLEAPPLEGTRDFVLGNIRDEATQFVALDRERVVGWIDICPPKREGLKHYGNLGMGVLPEFRSQGLGRKLMVAALADARLKGLECVRLEVFASNAPALKFYESIGFAREGLKTRARKMGARYDDIVLMAYFFPA